MQQQGWLTPDQVDTAVNVGVTVGIVSGIVGGAIGVGLWILMAWANGKGKTWARIVAPAASRARHVPFVGSRPCMRDAVDSTGRAP